LTSFSKDVLVDDIMRQLRITVVATLTLMTAATHAEDRATAPRLSDIDRTRLAEAFRLADAIGNKVWLDWDKAPFAVLLVTPDHEFLIRHPKSSDDFTALGEDTVLKQKIWSRKRKFETNLLATFPAVGGVPTIVIGQAENAAAKTSTRWVITVLHEHFHQLQNAQPRYYAEVDSLGLARGDTTGMWMLNYDFPYSKREVKEQFAVMSKSLAEALASRQQAGFADKLATYIESRKKFRSLLAPDDSKYLSFQVWQEGIARYTEYHVADVAAAEYEPTKEFKALKDYTSFKDEARAIATGIERELTTVQLDKSKRTAFYALGAGEGLLLDAASPGWRKEYFAEKFSLEKHFRTDK
jgi:hypothetical protein